MNMELRKNPGLCFSTTHITPAKKRFDVFVSFVTKKNVKFLQFYKKTDKFYDNYDPKNRFQLDAKNKFFSVNDCAIQ